jgi:hypothetical protein
MSEKKEEQSRLTITGNKMPSDIYQKLAQYGKDRKLTPYIIMLVEKEKMMDTLISQLSTLIEKVNTIDSKIDQLEDKSHSSNIKYEEETVTSEDNITQGDLEISSQIIGGIEEEIPEMDF